jgi:hypothetical protein
MPFVVKLDKFNRQRIAWLTVLYGLLLLFAYAARLYLSEVLPVVGLTIGLTGLLYTASRMVRHGKHVVWLFLLGGITIYFLPSADGFDLLRAPGTAAPYPANADAVVILKTNIQRIQQTLLPFAGTIRRLVVIDRRQSALAFVSAVLLYACGRLLRQAVLSPRSFRRFEAAVWILYELPDRFSRYVSMEILLSVYCGAGWLIALTVLGVPHAVELALLFGLGAVTPRIGMLWGASLAIFFLPWQQTALLQLTGLIIAFAVIWFGKYLLFSRSLSRTRHPHPTAAILAGFVAGLVFAGYPGAFFAWPLYAAAHIMAIHCQHGLSALRSRGLVPARPPLS